MRQAFNPVRLLIEILAIVALAEAVVMLVLPVIAPGVDGLTEGLLDASLLMLLSGHAVFWRLLAAAKQTAPGSSGRASSDITFRSAIVLTASAQVLGLVLTLAGVMWQQRSISETARLQFDRGADRIETEIKRRLDLPLYGLKGARGVFAANENTSHREFRDYVESRDLLREFPGVRGFGFIERVQRADVASYVARQRAQGAPDFEVQTSGNAPDLYVIKHIEPLAANRAAWGFDAGQEAYRREAAARAVRTGEPALSRRITLVQDGKQGAGFLYFLPVYRHESNGYSSSATPQYRMAQLLGLLYAPIVVAEMLDGVVNAAEGAIEFELFDGTTTSADNLLFDADAHLKGTEGTITQSAYAGRMFEASRSFTVGGLPMTLRTSTLPAFDASIDRSSVAFVGLGGALVSFLLAFTVWLLAIGRVRAQRIAQHMTADLDRLARVVQHTSSSVLITDAQRRINWVNESFTRISGYTLDEARGRTPRELLSSGKADPATLAVLMQAAKAGEPCRAEILNHAKDGREYWIETDVQPTRDADGALTGFMEIGTDITERKQAQIRLQLAASVFTHAREGITITDARGTIIEVNDTFTRITGYSREEAVGKNSRLLQSGRQTPEFYASMWQALLQTGHWTGELWNRKKSGEEYAEILTISAVRDADNNTLHYVALFTDITQIKEHQRRLEHIAHFDALTGLPNRVMMGDRLQQAMLQCQRREQSLAVVYIDLDGFKAVNDKYGHALGDDLLIVLAQRMKAAMREGDTLARIGGDEFVALLADLELPQHCEPVLARLLHAAADPVNVGDAVLQVSASMGVTIYPQDGSDADVLMRHADQSMYAAKQAGKNRYHLFDVAKDTAVKTQRAGLEEIRHALDHKQFVLFYQPKVNMNSGKVIGAEALIRWQHPERGLLPPGLFLPIIEDQPISVEVGEWVIESALTQMSQWQADGLLLPVSVNVGARQLQHSGFVDHLSAQLAAHPEVKPQFLELEILETSALEDTTQVSGVMHKCQAMGVRFALDDFGTGYSSLTYLKRLPAELIKIDQSFVRDMIDDPDDLAIVKGVIGLAAAFRREVIAEGVETVAHGELLLAQGCDLAQGYGIARPMPAADVPAWVARWHPDAAWLAWRERPSSRDDVALALGKMAQRRAELGYATGATLTIDAIKDPSA